MTQNTFTDVRLCLVKMTSANKEAVEYFNVTVSIEGKTGRYKPQIISNIIANKATVNS